MKKKLPSNRMFLPIVSGAGTEYASYTSSPYTQYTSSPYAGYSYSTNGTSGLLSRYFAYILGSLVDYCRQCNTICSVITAVNYISISRVAYWCHNNNSMTTSVKLHLNFEKFIKVQHFHNCPFNWLFKKNDKNKNVCIRLYIIWSGMYWGGFM